MKYSKFLSVLALAPLALAGILSIRAQSAPPAAPPDPLIQKWEYAEFGFDMTAYISIQGTTVEGKDFGEAIEKLNHQKNPGMSSHSTMVWMGSMGWELVTTIQNQKSSIWYFKRPGK